MLALGLPIYRTQRTTNPGQHPGLGFLLAALKGAGMDESWFRFLNGFLARPMGLNERNELLHGFIDDPTESTAALALLGALYLAVGIELKPADAEPPA